MFYDTSRLQGLGALFAVFTKLHFFKLMNGPKKFENY